MTATDRPTEELLREIADLRARLREAEERGLGVCLSDLSQRKQNEDLADPVDYRFLEMNRELSESEARLQSANDELLCANLGLKKAYEELQFQGEEIQAQTEELQEQNRELARLWDISSRAESALLELNEELESRVARRTAELADNVESLKLEIGVRESAQKALLEETAGRLLAVESLREKEQILIQQSRLAAMGEMINNIAHQWRQPLNTLGLTIQAVQMHHEFDELTKEVMEQSVRTSMTLIQHMSQTIDDFRNYFKPEQTMVDFRVSQVISSTLAIIEGSFKHENVAVEVAERDDPVVYGYRNEFAQSLLNILNNARDALTERKVDQPRVRIAVSGESGRAVVTISDNAGGIPEAILARVFDPYFTTKPSEKGTGLGLYMTRNIIEKKMGGSLTVRNTEEGAEFRIAV